MMMMIFFIERSKCGDDDVLMIERSEYGDDDDVSDQKIRSHL